MTDYIDIQSSDAKSPDLFCIPPHYQDDIESVLISNGQIRDRIERLAADIMKTKYDHLVCICVLKGGFQFFVDLQTEMKKILVNRGQSMSMTYEFVKLKSYVGDKSSGKVEISGMNLETVKNKHILVIEDIIDTARSAVALTEEIKKFNPKSMKFASLLLKKGAQIMPFKADYIGFAIPDVFLVGYALDLNEYFRDMSHMCVMKKSALEKYKE
jgi:hypoxanthine phosphoribosyltransferase